MKRQEAEAIEKVLDEYFCQRDSPEALRAAMHSLKLQYEARQMSPTARKKNAKKMRDMLARDYERKKAIQWANLNGGN